MKLQSILHNNKVRWGIRENESLRLLNDDWGTCVAQLMSGEMPNAEGDLHLPNSGITCTPPLGATSKILCVGLNYRSHVAEAKRDTPPHPSVFPRFADSLVAHGQPIWLPKESTKFDFEGELAIVIGKGGRHIAARDAFDHVAGYTCMAENSVRDFQKHNTQVTPGKNFERSGALGPWIVSAKDIPDPTELRVVTRLNDEVMQDASVADLIYPIPMLIEYISRFTRLSPGDVIATGTPAGVGSGRTPPRFMQAGDRLEVHIEHIGTLQNTVVGEPA